VQGQRLLTTQVDHPAAGETDLDVAEHYAEQREDPQAPPQGQLPALPERGALERDEEVDRYRVRRQPGRLGLPQRVHPVGLPVGEQAQVLLRLTGIGGSSDFTVQADDPPMIDLLSFRAVVPRIGRGPGTSGPLRRMTRPGRRVDVHANG
jgi:hypothetical protein